MKNNKAWENHLQSLKERVKECYRDLMLQRLFSVTFRETKKTRNWTIYLIAFLCVMQDIWGVSLIQPHFLWCFMV